ncbi:hypothetical protein E2320_018385 [Naja naja]|nr:hypothetical protein E2320_018385 [Naja naja]
MKILYLLFAFLFLVCLSQPGNAQSQCGSLRGVCYRPYCPHGLQYLGQVDCPWGAVCCRRFAKHRIYLKLTLINLLFYLICIEPIENNVISIYHSECRQDMANDLRLLPAIALPFFT